MHRLNRIVLFLWLVCQIISPGHVSADPSIANQLQEILSHVVTMHSSFSQVTLGADNQKLQTSEGELWLGGNARFRIVTARPFEQILVSDGIDFWSYDADLEQVIVSPLETDLQKVPILLFGNTDINMLANYQLSFYEENGSNGIVQHYVLKPMAPESLFETLTIGLVDSSPVEISILDSLDQKTRIRFHEAELNNPIPDEVFVFKTPDSVDVIDDR